jgi:hypothetical protein
MRMIVEKKPEKSAVMVRVVGDFRVVHEAQAYTNGDQVAVPQHMADEWLRARWVERVSSSKAD